MILEFLKTKRTKEELSLTLDILEEFKSHEDKEEWLFGSSESWVKLEQFEDCLRVLTDREADKSKDDMGRDNLMTIPLKKKPWHGVKR